MLHFGLVGCGSIAQQRAQALAASPVARLRAVFDADPARASAFAQQFHVEAAPSLDALLARPDLDAVVVSTPPDSHAPIAIAALNAGKHVLCEKPLARTPDEARLILDTAARNARTLATGFNFRFYPSVAKARELFQSGAIGELDHIRASCGYRIDPASGWLHDASITGGGALQDNGIHLIDTVLHFLGDPAGSEGHATETHGHSTSPLYHWPGCEENGFLLLRNAQGRVATLQASWTEWAGYHFRVELHGTLGLIRFTCFPMVTELITAQGRQRFLHPHANLMEKLKSYRWIVVQSFLREFEEFARLVAGQPSLIATGHDGWRAVHAAAAARGRA